MRTLDTIQEQLSKDAKLAPVNLLAITTYSDRAAETVGTVFYISDRAISYDWKNAGTVRRFLPWLADGGLGDLACSITHLPHRASGELLRKSLTITLHNHLWPDDASGTRIIELLRASYPLEGATIELGQYLVQAQAAEYPADYTAADGDEHTFFYRGRVARVGPITDKAITLECVADLPAMTWLRGSDATEVDPRDLGARVAKVYGRAKKVPCINWDVGFVTTLATAVDTDDTTFVLSDATGFGTTGRGVIGGEVIEWTGKSGNSLTGVTRQVDVSPPSKHRAGGILIEAIVSAVFLVADHAVDAIGDVYAHSPYTGLLTRLTGSFTKTIADTTTVSGETVASISFTQQQIVDALREMAASPHVTDDGTTPPDPTVLQIPIMEDIDLDTSAFVRTWYSVGMKVASSSGPHVPSLAENDVVRLRFYRPSTGFSRQKITVRLRRNSGSANLKVYGNQYPSGTPSPVLLDTQAITAGYNSYTVSTTGDYEWISLEIAGGTIDVDLHYVYQQIDNDDGLAFQQGAAGNWDGKTGGEGATNLNDGSDSTNEVFTSRDWWGVRFSAPAGSYQTQRLRVVMDIDNVDPQCKFYVGTSWSNVDWTEIRPADSAWFLDPGGKTKLEYWLETEAQGNYFTMAKQIGAATFTVYQMDRELLTYASIPPLDIAIAGASIGHGLQLFADCDGYVAPSASPAYKAGTGNLVEKPCDVLRHMIEVLGGGAIDTTSYDACDTNLGSDKLAVDLRALTPGPWEIAAAGLGFLSRTTLIPEEAAAGTVWKMLAAESDYGWPAAGRRLSSWDACAEVSANDRAVGPDGGQEIYTRYTILYSHNPGAGFGDERDFESWLQGNEDVSDFTDPNTTALAAAVDKYGNFEAPPISLLGIVEQATAKEIGGYYAHEGIRAPRSFLLAGVPWREAYDLESGDVIDFVHPWSGDTVKVRVLECVKSFRTEQAELRCVEVE